MTTVHTLAPLAGVPCGYFDEKNIFFIQNKVTEILLQDFAQHVMIDRASVIRVMQRIVEEWVQPIPQMNQRVIMELCREFRAHWIQTNKHLMWEEMYPYTQQFYDKNAQIIRYDSQIIKKPNRLGVEKVKGGSRTHFYFT